MSKRRFMLRRIALFLIASLVASCAVPIGPIVPAPVPTSAPIVAPVPMPTAAPRWTATVARATSAPSSTAVAPVVTPAPSDISAATATPTPRPEPAAINWELYQLALRPAVARQLVPEMQPGGSLSRLTQYSLTLTLSADLRRLDGRARVTYTNTEEEPLGALYFHLFPNVWNGGMAVGDIAVNGRAVMPILEADDDLLRVPLDRPLEPGQWVQIAIDFRVPVPNNTEVGNYADFAYVNGILALAHAYPTVAVYDSGWRLETPALQGDVLYHDASLYDVSLTAPKDLVVAATGATIGRVENPDGTATWRLAGGPLRDFNIVASARYKISNRQVGDITVNSYYLPEDTVGGQKTLEWAALALQVYQSEFGTYPYRELDVAATETTAGGIEYPGLIVVARRLYSDPNNIIAFEGVTIHEVAHQWWYNVVGNDQINAPWLDEALTQYSTSFYYRRAYGPDAVANLLDSFRARWSRANYEEKPIGLPVSAYPDQEYSAIVYGRGPLFFMALRDRIGADRMAALLRRYYAEYAWQIASPADFRRLAEEIAGEKLDDLWAQWVEPQQVGNAPSCSPTCR